MTKSAMELVMKILFSTILLLNLFSNSALAEIETVKLEKGINLKFNNELWKYQYVKVLSSITPHIVESKKEDLKVIIQKETHAVGTEKAQALISTKCKDADAFYKNAKQGSAKTIDINGKQACYVQLVKSEKNTYQILYPVNMNTSTYDLVSFAWNAADEKNFPTVKMLVGENI